MTIKEAQELMGIVCGKHEKYGDGRRAATADEICERFCGVLCEADASGIDLTEALVNWLDEKNRCG